MKAFKAFDKNFQCRGYQFEEGKAFETDSASLCNTGFHACENPLDVLNYYDLTESRFAEVDLDATDETHEDDSKRVGKKIHIKAELTLKGFIKAAIDFLIGDTKSEVDPNNRAQLASSGYGAQLASSGDGAQLASSGYGAKLASSGDGAQLASSGDGAKLASSGNGAKLASSGDGAKLASSGYGAKLASSGDGAVVMSAGIEGKAKAKKGSWISIAEWKWDGEKNIPACVKSAIIDGETLKEDTYYTVKDGEFVEIQGEDE